MNNRASTNLPTCSYLSDIVPTRLDQVLPSFVAKRLQRAFDLFRKSMRGYLTNEAVIVGVESRTSSRVSIPRDQETVQILS